ncbi:MAG: rod shape-determining protein MreD [Dermatophilaceae bacterium]
MTTALRIAALLALALAGAVLVVALRARGWSAVPELALLPVVAFGLSRGWPAGAALGLVVGLLVDLVPPGGDPLGLTPILYALAGSLAGRASRVGPVPVRWVAIVVLGSAAVPVVGRLLLGAWQGQQLDLATAALTLAATVVAGVVLVPPLLRLDREEPAW